MPLATREQTFQELWNYGFFSGFERIVAKYNPSTQEAGGFKKYIYKRLLDEVLEAKKELTRLEAVIQRMESKCRQGMLTNGNPREGWDTNSRALLEDLRAFDGWVVSLFESDITLLHYIKNIETAHTRSNGIHDAVRNVMMKRMKEQKLFETETASFALKFHG